MSRNVTPGGQYREMADSVDLKIITTARALGGACTREDLRTAGVSDASISRKQDGRVLTKVAKNVYIAPTVADGLSLLRASLMALPDAAASFHTAGRLHGFPVDHRRRTIVTTPRPTSVKIPDVEIRRSRFFDPEEAVMGNGIRMTDPARTLFDIACELVPVERRPSQMRAAGAVHLLETQFARRTPAIGDFVAWLDGRGGTSGIRGAGHVRHLALTMFDGQPFPESQLEGMLFDGLQSRGVSGIERQFQPPWYDGIRGVVDGADPVGRTILEADGRSFRQVTAAHDNDRVRATRRPWPMVG